MADSSAVAATNAGTEWACVLQGYLLIKESDMKMRWYLVVYAVGFLLGAWMGHASRLGL